MAKLPEMQIGGWDDAAFAFGGACPESTSMSSSTRTDLSVVRCTLCHGISSRGCSMLEGLANAALHAYGLTFLPHDHNQVAGGECLGPLLRLACRCVSQMVLARVANVKSGWKSMFMVFTTAAGDEQQTIVRLAFDTIEKIVREHFDYITETEITTFTDCVNCLIAFTNNPHSIDVSLNSIAFLRFCAMKLAEGAIGELHRRFEQSLLPRAALLSAIAFCTMKLAEGSTGEPGFECVVVRLQFADLM